VTADEDGPVLFAEAGSSWWPLAWGPLLALPGVLIEATGGGAIPLWVWLLAGAGLTVYTAAWVAARRRFREVRLTPTQLRGGREVLPVARITAVDDVGTSMGAPVVGGSWLVPRGTTGIPLRLDDGSTVLAWARDAEALGAALRRLVGARSPDGPAAGGDG
jgi:hypothetical protein